MALTHIPYQKTNYFSTLMIDYLAEKEILKPFFSRFPRIENFEEQFCEKKEFFSKKKREVLVASLTKQYEGFEVSKLTQQNIDLLLNDNTFTITTGHQLNLFTGPLYFLYKIVSTVNLSEDLNKKYSKQHFVPIYWMASEDHDFSEINYFNLFGNKMGWSHESGGAVGELDTCGLNKLLESLKPKFGTSENAKKLIDLFSRSYLNHDNLSDATRYIANELFAEYGLVILDGNDRELKEEFAPFAQNELFDNKSFSIINETTNRLEAIDYKKQVHPREINLFYIIEGIRERIIEDQGLFIINNTALVFSRDEILVELKNHPERFSPNALLRPLYQEVVLPNLCYIGGGGELAYWFQLKDYFKSMEVTFPILLLRNSLLLVPQKISKKNVLELGTSIGLGSAAMAFASKNSIITTVEVNKNLSDIAKKVFRSYQLKNIRIDNSAFKDFFKNINNKHLDLVYLDGTYDKKNTIENFNSLLKHAHNESVFIFNNIYCNKEMTEAWNIIKKQKKVTVSIDTFYWGFLFFRKEQPKQHFTIRL